MRASRIQAAENRETVINVASRLFRERGFDGIGLKGLMERAGLTQGAFYKQCASKEDLVAQASRRALESASHLMVRGGRVEFRGSPGCGDRVLDMPGRGQEAVTPVISIANLALSERRLTGGILLLLAGLAALGALATSIILPAFPRIGAGLGVSSREGE